MFALAAGSRVCLVRIIDIVINEKGILSFLWCVYF